MARRQGTSGAGSWGYKKALLDKEGWYPDCIYCNEPYHLVDAQVDHIDPIHNGGPNLKSNKIAVCTNCNREKSSKTLLGFLLEKKINPERVYWKLKGYNKLIPIDLLDYLGFPE